MTHVQAPGKVKAPLSLHMFTKVRMWSIYFLFDCVARQSIDGGHSRSLASYEVRLLNSLRTSPGTLVTQGLRSRFESFVLAMCVLVLLRMCACMRMHSCVFSTQMCHIMRVHMRALERVCAFG